MTGLLAWDYWTPRPAFWQNGSAVVIVLVAFALIGRWLHAHRNVLRIEDQLKEQQRNMPQRTIPLSPVQSQYLTRIEHYTKR